MRKSSGFTLIELMVTLAVAAIALGIAIPSFNDAIANNRSAGLGTELLAAINYARSESVKQGKRVTLCPSENGTSCLESATGWPKGWLVFVDGATSDSAAIVLGPAMMFWDNLDKKASVSLKKGSASISYLRFNSRGMLARTGTNDTDTRVFDAYIAGCKGDAARRITINAAGSVSSSKLACPAGT